jgi:hypothetical protein
MLLPVALWAPPGLAQDQLVPGTTGLGLRKEDFSIRLLRGETPLTEFEQKYFFNRARCECETTLQIEIRLSAAGRAKLGTQNKSGSLDVIAGSSDCVSQDKSVRASASCTALRDTANLNDLVNGDLIVDTTVKELFRPSKDAAVDCTREATRSIYLLVDAEKDGSLDLADTSAPQVPLDLDGAGPKAPSEVKVRGGNGAIEVSWKAADGTLGLAGHVLFCSRGGDTAVYAKSGYDDQFSTSAALCPGKVTGALVTAEPASAELPVQFALAGDAEGDGIPGPAPAAFTRLDPDFLCSDLLTTQTSKRLTGLQNGVPYLVGVAAVDKSGNASPITSAYMQVPIPTRDFYTGYRTDGGEAEGGFCRVAPTGRRPGAIELGATTGFGVVVLITRRRRARRGGSR